MLIRHSSYQLIGRFSALIANAVSAPLYIAYLGAESFGVVGIYLSFFAFMGLFDLGLPASANRQLSTMIGKRESNEDLFSLIRAFELAIWGITLLSCLTLLLLSGYLAESWLNNELLSTDTVKEALMLASIAAALRFPTGFYSNVLFAFEKHLSSNLLTTCFAMGRVIFTLLTLSFIEASLYVFFWSQIIINACEILCFAFFIWRKQSCGFLTKPDWHGFKQSTHMTIILTGVSFSALAQSQIDKVLLSKWLTLSDFGVYSLAYSLAIGILPISYAVANAAFPAISRAIGKSESIDKMSVIISDANAILTVLIFPVCIVFAALSYNLEPFLALFTSESEMLSLLLMPMFLAALFQSNTVLPHQYRIAQGRPVFILMINVSLILPYVVLLYGFIKYFGAVGAAYAFLCVNISSCILHWGTLSVKQDAAIWKKVIYKNTILLIFSIAFVSILKTLLYSVQLSVIELILSFGLVWVVCCFMIICWFPYLKAFVQKKIRNMLLLKF